MHRIFVGYKLYKYMYIYIYCAFRKMLVVESLFGYCKCLFLNIPNGVCFHGWAGRTPVQVGLMIDSILHDPKQSGIFFNR